MRGSRHDRILAGTALAIVLAVASVAEAASPKVPVLARDPIPAPPAATAASDFEAPPDAPAKTESVPAPTATAPAVTAPAPAAAATTAAPAAATPVATAPTAP